MIAFDGTENEPGRQGDLLRAAAAGKGEVTVLRGGKAIELRPEYGNVRNPVRAGGGLLDAARK